MFSNFGVKEILVIAIILFLFLSGKKLIELARGLGESTKEVKKIRKEFQSASDNEPTETEEKTNDYKKLDDASN